jgi:hypothetical protein
MRGGGGILLIGGGVFLLILGWTGKFQDVWNALTGGGSGGTSGGSNLPPPDKPSQPITCTKDSDCPNNWQCSSAASSTGGRVCIPKDSGGTGAMGCGAVCQKSETCVRKQGATRSDCVGNASLASPENGQCRESYVPCRDVYRQIDLCCNIAAGAGYGKVYDELPTGFVGLRRNPSAGFHSQVG